MGGGERGRGGEKRGRGVGFGGADEGREVGGREEGRGGGWEEEKEGGVNALLPISVYSSPSESVNDRGKGRRKL